MSVTLSKGYKRPQAGDPGSSFFPDLEYDITRVNDHKHDGLDSPQLGPEASKALKVTPAGSWVSSGTGYKKVVTIPSVLTASGITFDLLSIELRESATGEALYLSTKRVNSSSFEVYSNDNSLNFDVVYTT